MRAEKKNKGVPPSGSGSPYKSSAKKPAGFPYDPSRKWYKPETPPQDGQLVWLKYWAWNQPGTEVKELPGIYDAEHGEYRSFGDGKLYPPISWRPLVAAPSDQLINILHLLVQAVMAHPNSRVLLAKALNTLRNSASAIDRAAKPVPKGRKRSVPRKSATRRVTPNSNK